MVYFAVIMNYSAVQESHLADWHVNKANGSRIAGSSAALRYFFLQRCVMTITGSFRFGIIISASQVLLGIGTRSVRTTIQN